MSQIDRETELLTRSSELLKSLEATRGELETLKAQLAKTRDTYRRIREAAGKPADYGVDLVDWILHMRNRRDELSADLGREMDETNRLEEEIEKLKAERNHEHRIIQTIINDFCQFCRDSVPLDAAVQVTAKGESWTHHDGKTNCGASRLKRVIEGQALRSAPPSSILVHPKMPTAELGREKAIDQEPEPVKGEYSPAPTQAPYDKTNAGEERRDLARQGSDATKSVSRTEGPEMASASMRGSLASEQVPAGEATATRVASIGPRSHADISKDSYLVTDCAAGPQDSPSCSEPHSRKSRRKEMKAYRRRTRRAVLAQMPYREAGEWASDLIKVAAIKVGSGAEQHEEWQVSFCNTAMMARPDKATADRIVAEAHRILRRKLRHYAAQEKRALMCKLAFQSRNPEPSAPPSPAREKEKAE